MKNQYFGDAGDYGKYGMLRFLAKNDIKIAVNWYLTGDDGSNDGRHISYLQDYRMSCYDEELFELLKGMVESGERNIKKFEEKNVIAGASYFSDLLKVTGNSRTEKQERRRKWHEKALDACAGAELVFLDPDNGACDAEPSTLKDSVKYCYADEIADYYERGQNVVYYCSKGRRSYHDWENTKSLMQHRLPEAKLAIITFHKGTQRSYIFVIHKEDFRRYSQLLRMFLRKWPKLFTEEPGFVGSLNGEKTGEKFHVKSSTGVELTLEEGEDGWISFARSDIKGSTMKISIDDFVGRFSW